MSAFAQRGDRNRFAGLEHFGRDRLGSTLSETTDETQRPHHDTDGEPTATPLDESVAQTSGSEIREQSHGSDASDLDHGRTTSSAPATEDVEESDDHDAGHDSDGDDGASTVVDLVLDITLKTLQLGFDVVTRDAFTCCHGPVPFPESPS